MPDYKLILASGSPRRIQLLQTIFPNIQIIVPNIDEHIEAKPKSRSIGIKLLLPQEYVLTLAEKKAMSVVNKIDTGIVIAADTVVALGNKIFGKPHSAGEAKSMMKALQGKEHSVYTGVVILKIPTENVSGMKKSGNIIRKLAPLWRWFVEKSMVKIKAMSNAELDNYIATANWRDKAGAYGIQETPDIVESYSGDYYNIVGLPLDKTIETIKTVIQKSIGHGQKYKDRG